MRDFDFDEVFQVIRTNAFRHLTPRQRETTNLHIDLRVREPGETLGPRFQKIVADQASVLVFADDYPRANFAHDCRYLLFHPKTGELRREIAARFPPYGERPPETLVPFHQPFRVQPSQYLFKVWPYFRCPRLVPDGARYAILFSGMSNLRHLNDLEFCYRMLIDEYSFNSDNIYVLNYDGTMNTQDGAPTTGWPGDGTAYRIKVTGKGDRPAFQNAFDDLKNKIGSSDLLFIHTNNHGGNSSGQSFLCQYGTSQGPIHAWDEYWANDFCSDLGGLPKYRSLIAMMEQCESGGFNSPVISGNTAINSSIASAAPANLSSWSTSDGNFDVFALQWISAQFGHNANGSSLGSNPDVDGDGSIQAEEAYDYAVSNDSADSPTYQESSEAGGDITLGQQYTFGWVWCWILKPVLEKYYQPQPPNPPDPEFYSKLHEVLPELQKLVVPVLNRTTAEVKGQVVSQIEEVLSKAFRSREKVGQSKQ